VTRTQVLVAGAGPVGLTLACELERLGVDVRIADAALDRGAVSRATDLHARSLELWDHTGVAAAVIDAALPITGVPLFSGGREVARLDFGGVDSPFPAAVSLRQRDVERLLREHLERPVERGAEVELLDAEAGTVRLGGEEVGAEWVVACDGAHSGIRSRLGIPFRGGDYPGLWAVMDARIAGWPYGPGEIPVFLDREGFWAMPLPDGSVRLFFRHEGPGERPEAADGQAAIDRHVPGSARIESAENLACFRIHHRVAGAYRRARVLLAGDAAHAMTPVNGQGMNTGIQDAYNLAWKLRAVLSGAPDSLLDSYEAERRPVALATVRGSGQVHDANVLEGAAAEARDRGLAAAFATPAQVLAAVEQGHELDVSYRHSPVVGAQPPAGTLGPHPGDRIGDAGPLVRADGSETSLRELMRDAGHQLWVCCGTEPPAEAIELARGFARRLTARVFTVADRPQAADRGVEVLADPALRAHARLGAVVDGAYVVRPDGHLGARASPPAAAPIDDYLRLVS
jgi:2-polyprenyl-6-methoxyphenol hydroxylase-like FAD-dependent oxidoreductase